MKILLAIGAIFVAGGVLAHEGQVAVAPAEQFRPTPLPDRIVLTWDGDPARTQNVNWRTDTSVAAARAEIAVSTPGPEFILRTRVVPATTVPLDADLGPCHWHSVSFRELTPSTKYVYRVGDGVNWSEWFHFLTASDKAEPFSFIYFGDAQNDLRSHWSRVIREAYSDAPRARFMLHAGDLINRANNDAEWGEWFGAGHWLNAMLPSIATPGNHEYSGLLAAKAVSSHWRPQFAFPENGPDGLKETAYWLDYQGTRIVSLNSNERIEEQAQWLDRVLTDNTNRWTVLTFHHPIFSSALGRDNTALREAWKPVIDRHRVDLVLQGHDHSYGRTGLEVPQNLATGATALSGNTVYVVSVSGPKLYPIDRQPFMRRMAQGAQLYQIIHIQGDELRYEARVANGTLYDAFELHKRSDGTNELIENAPDVPELRSDLPKSK